MLAVSKVVVHTGAFPKQFVCNPVFRSVWVGIEPSCHMLDVSSIASIFRTGTAVVNMYMSSHVLADEIAHHWGTIIIRTKFSPVEFNHSIWIFDSSASF